MNPDVDQDCGVALPGPVLPAAGWTSTAWLDDGRPFDWKRCFGRTAGRVVDVGCGSGRYLIGSAVARPDLDHVGIDLVEPLVDRAARQANRRGLANVRFIAGDGVAWLFRRLEAGSVDEIHVYHPQPYYDPAEVSLGMLTPEFFARAWVVTRRGGIMVLQTDSKPYGRYLLNAVRNTFEPEVLTGPWPDAPLGRTRREIVALRKGLTIRRMVARRREAPLGVPAPQPYFEAKRRRVKRSKRPVEKQFQPHGPLVQGRQGVRKDLIRFGDLAFASSKANEEITLSTGIHLFL